VCHLPVPRLSCEVRLGLLWSMGTRRLRKVVWCSISVTGILGEACHCGLYLAAEDVTGNSDQRRMPNWYLLFSALSAAVLAQPTDEPSDRDQSEPCGPSDLCRTDTKINGPTRLSFVETSAIVDLRTDRPPKGCYIPVCQPLVLQALRPAFYSCGHDSRRYRGSDPAAPACRAGQIPRLVRRIRGRPRQ
jgi:hypothetical protein